jgi:hypothetical protein
VATYCYLGGEEPVINTRTLDPADLDQQRVLLETALADLDQGNYQRACHRPDCESCRRGLGAPPRPPSRAPAANGEPSAEKATVNGAEKHQ